MNNDKPIAMQPRDLKRPIHGRSKRVRMNRALKRHAEKVWKEEARLAKTAAKSETILQIGIRKLREWWNS